MAMIKTISSNQFKNKGEWGEIDRAKVIMKIQFLCSSLFIRIIKDDE